MSFEELALAVVSLDAPKAADPSVTGAKAANLARASVAGLPVLPGFVLVPAQRLPGAPTGQEAVRSAWQTLVGAHSTGRALVVRSSSVYEDTEDSSMAGQFDSVLDVTGWEEFVAAVRTVLGSARRVRPLRSSPQDAAGDGMAVLVQPMLASDVGGVMFSADPIEGRTDRILVSAVRGGPDQLVDGTTQGVRYQLTKRGRLVRAEPAERRETRLLPHRRITRLAALAGKTEQVFGGPQDVEFGFDTENRLWLFQARPITAMAKRPARSTRLLGPGPVAETFPAVLQPLEEDLWVTPMAHGLSLALDIAGTTSRSSLRKVPVVSTVQGHAVADLRLLGAVPPRHPFLERLNPLPGARRASAAWRVGRLRRALPLLAIDLMADVDRALTDFPPPPEMLSGQLLDSVTWGRQVLSALHAQESLAGALLDSGSGPGTTVAGEALAELAEGRSQGLNDQELMERHPAVLALLAPTLADRGPLPLPAAGRTALPRGVGALPVREGLRLRIRWVQEMQAQMLRELARRLGVGSCELGLSRLVLLRWEELLRVARGDALPADFAGRVPRPDVGALPAEFRLADGVPVAEPRRGVRTPGQGSGGGFATGTAWDGRGARPDHPVLVVRFLDPALAPLLPDLAGLVAETGSPLSHLALLAREYRIPTAVGIPGATESFVPGTLLTVDGGTGAVNVIGVPETATLNVPTRQESAA